MSGNTSLPMAIQYQDKRHRANQSRAAKRGGSVNQTLGNGLVLFGLLGLLLSSCATRNDSNHSGKELRVIRSFVVVGTPGVRTEVKKENENHWSARGEPVPKPVDYQPNSPGSAGLAIGWRGSSFSWSTPISRKSEDSDRGSTKGRDTQFHGVWGSMAVDVVDQSFQGFYSQRESEDGSKTLFEPIPEMNMKRQVITLSFFNSDSFNYNAAFNQMEVIDKNGFTFIAALSADRSKLRGLPDELTSALYGGEGYLNSAEYITYGATYGIGLTGVVPRVGLFGSLLATTGAARQYYKLDVSLDEDSVTKQKTSLKTSFRMAFGIDRRSWFFGSSAWGDSSYVLYGPYEVALQSNQIELFLGARF